MGAGDFRIHKSDQMMWTDKVTWRWPAADRKLVSVFNDVKDIDDVIMKHVTNTSVCIQAGGACGVWPLRFSQIFNHVYTFEPQPINYQCLKFNCFDADNITAFNAPLCNKHAKYSIHNSIYERENFGAGYIVPDEKGLEAMCIDDLGVDDCGLIQLDIEGFELEALIGGYKTIERFKPVIVLEEKPLKHMPTRFDHTAPRRWLQDEFGYKQVGSIHRDVILSV